MPVVDVHTHLYPPSYIRLLQSRTSPPYIRTFPLSSEPTSPRLIILPGEEAAAAAAEKHAESPSDATPLPPGRPIGPEYSSIIQKLQFMDQHGIDISVVSLANPWLDFLPANEASAAATALNDELNTLCQDHGGTGNRLFAFGALPLSASDPQQIVAEIDRLTTLPRMRGVIIGTSGLGAGLDDPLLNPIWAALEKTQSLIFLHPHYGLPSSVFGPLASQSGHVLPLALGFPLETTIAVTRMLLAGVWDRFPRLQVLLAHSGGTLPFLAGRIQSCIEHDGYLEKQGSLEGRRSVWDVLKNNIYLDAVIYSEVGLKAAVEASGKDRVLFGTDHPFFPPLNAESSTGVSKEDGEGGKWPSVRTNYEAINRAFGGDGMDGDTAGRVLGGNAVRILNLKV